MEKYLNALENCELFHGVSRQCLKESVLPLCVYRAAGKGQVLLAPQQRAEHLAIVLSGRISIQHIFPDGGCSLTNVVPEGEVLWADLVCTRSRLCPYHVSAAVRSELLFLPADILTRPGQLEESLRQGILERLLVLISQENMKKEYRLAILSRHGLRERIIAYLTMQRNRLNRNPFRVTLSREEMASFLCVNRSALSHELSLMQREGILRFHRNEFWLSGENNTKSEQIMLTL